MSKVFIFNTTAHNLDISVNRNTIGPLAPASPEPAMMSAERDISAGPLRDGRFYQSKDNTLTALGPNEQYVFEGINPTLSSDFTNDLAIYIFRSFMVLSDGGKVLQKIDSK